MDDAYAFEGYEDEVFDEYEAVGTVDVQILLSWFFETADPAELDIEYGRAG